MIRTKENGKQCIITRDGDKGTVIRQQDITKGVRLLGVKAAANGTFEQEFLSRLEKSRELAGRLQAAPLNIALSWQVYYCRWKPAITYCLPITTFSATECKKLQSPFYAALLPKLGINRHMPRALLHGPQQVAGLGLINLEAEQLAMHVTGMVAQLRKNDRVGQTMHASIDALQLYLGIEEHFFTQVAVELEHRPSRRESQLVYIWEELNSIDCSLLSNRFWTPTSKGEHDVAILEAIIKIKKQRQGTSNHLPKTAIWYTNACRLYLRVTMLSEICTPCGKYVEEWALNGTRRNDMTSLIYPYQRKPPPQVWKVWRDSLLAAFLTTRTQGRPTLHIPFEIEIIDENAPPWRTRIIHGMRLEEAIDLLPGYIREAIGTLNYPLNNGKQLSNDILGSASTSYTDGTVKNTIGAHSYTIRTIDDCEDTCIQGAGGTPGDFNSMTSLRAEHFGVYVTIILLDIISLIHGHRSVGTHVHYTDSKAVIDRVNGEEYMTDKHYDCTDFDIWKETEDAILQAKHIIFQIRHVKGHQRETLYTEQGKQGPLTREATYNDWCDGAAEREREDHQAPVQLCFIQAAAVYLKTSHTLVTASAYKIVYDKKTTPLAEDYVRNKLSLTEAKQQMINWDAMGNYFKSLAISQKVKVMKYIYDWQNVGSQKEQQQWADTEEYMCPYKCGQKEIPMHHLICAISCDKMSRMCMEAINRWMIMVRTNNRIRVYLMEIFYSKLPMTRNELNIEYRTPALFEQARYEQEQLGWRLTIKGLLSKKWGVIQEEEYARIRSREKLEIWYTGTWWTKSLIKNIIFWALNEWQKRNEHLHKDIKQRKTESIRRQNNEEIIELYQHQEDRPIAKIKRYYKTPLIDKLQQNPNRQRQWIETIRALRDKVTTQTSKNKL